LRLKNRYAGAHFEGGELGPTESGDVPQPAELFALRGELLLTTPV